MGSPITFSGFNSIDFTAVLEAVMKQESQPLTTLQTQQKALQSKAATFRTLATKLATFESAVSALKDDNALLGRTASSTMIPRSRSPPAPPPRRASTTSRSRSWPAPR